MATDLTLSRKAFLAGAGLAVAGASVAAHGFLPCAGASEAADTMAASGSDGVYSASVLGFGGDVEVTVTISGGKVESIEISGPNETPDRGGAAIERYKESLVGIESTENVDIVSGATVTSNAVLRATEDCFAQAGLIARDGSLSMKPGIYVGEGMGFDWVEPVRVKIEVDETSLLSIEVIEKGLNREEPLILKAAEDLLIPRIVESQSLDVEAITGATSVSNGIKAATEDALKKAIRAAGSDASAVEHFHVAVRPEEATVELEYDAVVCGMGGAGSAAAMSLAEQMQAAGRPVSVLALETAGKYGGTAANAGTPFGINAPGTLARNGGEPWCEVETLREDWLAKYSDGTPCKVDCVDLILNESGTTIDWLISHGFVLSDPQSYFGSNPAWQCGYNYIYKSNMEEDIDYATEYPDYVFGDRSSSVGQYFDSMAKDFVDAGGEYLLETTAYELMYNTETNAVEGVKAYSKATNTYYTIHAKVVVLATGGFAGSQEMIDRYLDNPYYPNQAGEWNVWGMRQNKGQMIQSAIEQGAGTYNIDMPICVHFKTIDSYLTEYPTYYRDGLEERMQEQNMWSLNDVPMILGFDRNTLQVGPDGKRHFSEAGMFDFWQAGPVWYTIHGSDYIDNLAENGFAGEPGTYSSSTKVFGQGGYPNAHPIPQIYEVLQTAEAKGTAFIAETLEELAEKTGMPVSDFVDQVARYKGYCESGVDEEFGKSADNLLADRLQYGPYYAIKCNPTPYATVAALDVDTNINVLSADGVTEIAGLYACGNDSGGVIYSNTKPYVSYGGVALGWAFTSGRLAGIHAVEYLQGA